MKIGNNWVKKTAFSFQAAHLPDKVSSVLDVILMIENLGVNTNLDATRFGGHITFHERLPLFSGIYLLSESTYGKCISLESKNGEKASVWKKSLRIIAQVTNCLR